MHRTASPSYSTYACNSTKDHYLTISNPPSPILSSKGKARIDPNAKHNNAMKRLPSPFPSMRNSREHVNKIKKQKERDSSNQMQKKMSIMFIVIQEKSSSPRLSNQSIPPIPFPRKRPNSPTWQFRRTKKKRHLSRTAMIERRRTQNKG